MQCPKDRAPHTMAFDGSVMGTLRDGSVKPRQQSADCEVRTLPPAPPGCTWNLRQNRWVDRIEIFRTLKYNRPNAAIGLGQSD